MARIATKGEALRLHQRGWSVPRIAQELGVREDSVRRSLERAGVRLRKPAAGGVCVAPAADNPSAMVAVLPVLERWIQIASLVREMATEYLDRHQGEPAAQEFHIAAKQAKEFAGDCLFYFRLCLGAVATEACGEATQLTDFEILNRIIESIRGSRQSQACMAAECVNTCSQVTSEES